MIRRPPRSTRTDTPFPTRRSSDLPAAQPRAGNHGGGHDPGAGRLARHARAGERRIANIIAALDPDTMSDPRWDRVERRRTGMSESKSTAHADRKSTRLNSSH